MTLCPRKGGASAELLRCFASFPPSLSHKHSFPITRRKAGLSSIYTRRTRAAPHFHLRARITLLLPFTSRAMLLPWLLPLALFLSTVTPSHAHTASHHQLAEHALERRAAAATCAAGTGLVGSFWPAWLSGTQPPSKFPWSKNQLAFYFGALARWWKAVGTQADAFAETASISGRDYPRGYLSAWRAIHGRHCSIRQAGSSE